MKIEQMILKSMYDSFFIGVVAVLGVYLALGIYINHIYVSIVILIIGIGLVIKLSRSSENTLNSAFSFITTFPLNKMEGARVLFLLSGMALTGSIICFILWLFSMKTSTIIIGTSCFLLFEAMKCKTDKTLLDFKQSMRASTPPPKSRASIFLKY